MVSGGIEPKIVGPGGSGRRNAPVKGGGAVGVVVEGSLGCWGGGRGGAVGLGVAVAVEEEGEGLDVVVEAELGHGPQHVLGGDGLALLALAPLVGLPSDEADVLRHALLDRLLRVVRYLGVRRQDPTHYPNHVRYRHEPVLLPHRALRRHTTLFSAAAILPVPLLAIPFSFIHINVGA